MKSYTCDWPGAHARVKCSELATRQLFIGIMAGSWRVCEAHAHMLIDDETTKPWPLQISVYHYPQPRLIAKLRPRGKR